MFRTNLFILTFLFNILLQAQQNKIFDNWALDKIEYTNGNSLEINHPLYSTMITYEISPNAVRINNKPLKSSISGNLIDFGSRKLNFRFENDYLILNEIGDDKSYYFLNYNDFIQRYPEVMPRKVMDSEKNLVESNRFCGFKLKNGMELHDYFTENIASYKEFSAGNHYFEAEFVLNTENEISDVHIIESLHKRFDKQFMNALENLKGQLENTCGKDILITEKFNFFKLGAGITNANEKELFELSKKIHKHYAANEFQAITELYPQLLAIKLDDFSAKRFNHRLKESYLRLGIAFLATEQGEIACEAFRKVGEEKDFIVRNYLLNFCPKRQ